MSRDGEAVVIHDEKLDRTTDATGFVKDWTWEELQGIKASKNAGPSEKIPALREVLAWLQGNELLVNIELKNTVFLYPGIEEIVIQLVRFFGLEERVIVSSFNHYSLVHSHMLAPEIETAPLYRDGLYMPWAYAQKLGACAIHPNIHAVPDVLIRASIQEGIAVRPYTINKEETVKRLCRIGCSAIITDYPEMAYSARKTCHI